MMRVLALIAVAGITGCSAGAPVPEQRNSTDVPTTANAIAAQPESSANAASAMPGPASGVLNAYVGKYPFDKVDGKSFLDQPLVREGVKEAVGDAKIREWIFDKTGPQSPIALVDGKLAAWGCQAHNCGGHQWTVLIAPDGSGTQVCYLPDGAAKPDWYEHGSRTARTDDCPSGD